ncbi:MAG: ATP-binding protein [Rhodobacteraceae bacterium]|nr:ATP-binding protein [Paracoccaceae bacterium]
MKKIEPESLVGADILNLVTTGMYHTPHAVYREYIQNSADAIERSLWPGQGRVDISISPANRSIKIRDNGPGLSPAQAKRYLIPIARSSKKHGIDRGFRGIGRLSGLAFADRIKFRTRSNKAQQVTEISWDGKLLRSNSDSSLSPEQIINNCVKVSIIDGDDWPDNFFEVKIEDVSRYAADKILNREAVRRYIGETGPVPMSDTFPFSKEVEPIVSNVKKLHTLEVILDDEEPVRRMHGHELIFSQDRTDTYKEIQELRIPDIEGENNAAVGWIAHTSYLGAVPKNLGVRGIRLRAGNIQIGEENVLDPFFNEERFNKWCIGELHVIDQRILPNGRRDYFDPSPHLRHMENHIQSIINEVVKRCRTASSNRIQSRKVQTVIEHMDNAYSLAGSGYLKAADSKALIAEALERLQELEHNMSEETINCNQNKIIIEELKKKLIDFKPRRGRPYLENVNSGEIAIYQRIFRALTELCNSPAMAKEMIEGVLKSA